MNFSPVNRDYIDIHSHHAYREKGIFRIYNLFPQDNFENQNDLLLSIGLHPWYIHEYPDKKNLYNNLLTIAGNQKVLFIGETGLDKFKEKDLSLQREIFIEHIRLSEEVHKPLIIHCVRAFEELLEIKNQIKPQQKWIIHGFDSSPEMAASLVKQGIYLSVGERLLKKPGKSKQVLALTPLSKLFIESDDGKTPIPELYRQVAEYYMIEIKDLKEFITGNFNFLFHE